MTPTFGTLDKSAARMGKRVMYGLSVAMVALSFSAMGCNKNKKED